MAYGGINVHKKQRQMCLLTEEELACLNASPHYGSSAQRSVLSAPRPASYVRGRSRAYGWQENAYGLFTGAAATRGRMSNCLA
jgi:hypothetical protein